MAVVSISRIQHRRGKKFSDTGIPQLASGELGWALDAQELYIGNGSVVEGAPYVGNTQILTEHSNLFDYTRAYTYRVNDEYIQTGSSSASPVQRSLQQRLDDTTSIRSFGATGDGTDQTAALQRAINQLFLNSVNKSDPVSRVVLHLDPGTYMVSSVIYLPPYVTLRGAGSGKTVITSTVSGPVFRTVNSLSVPGTPASDSLTTEANQATGLDISGITLNVADEYSGLLLVNCKDSVFSDIKIQGGWSTVDGAWDNSYAIKMQSLSSTVTCKNNIFVNCEFSGVYRAVASDDDVKNNIWDRCSFSDSAYGVVFGENTVLGSAAQATGPINNNISHSSFDNIDYHAFWVVNGKYNTSKDNAYYAVGYAGGTASNTGNVVTVIEFDDSTNVSVGDWFERTQLYGYDATYTSTIPYVSEISGSVAYENNTQHVLDIVFSSIPIQLFRLPVGEDRNITIDYLYTSQQVDVVRSGKLQITVDSSTQNVILSDDYNFSGDTQYQKSIEFSSTMLDLDSDGTYETLNVLYTNSTLNDSGTFKYTIQYNS